MGYAEDIKKARLLGFADSYVNLFMNIERTLRRLTKTQALEEQKKRFMKAVLDSNIPGLNKPVSFLVGYRGDYWFVRRDNILSLDFSKNENIESHV